MLIHLGEPQGVLSTGKEKQAGERKLWKSKLQNVNNGYF